MKPLWKAPRQGMRIYRSVRPQTGHSLSGIAVWDRHEGMAVERLVAPVRFNDSTVDRMAKAMPRGIGPAEPAYIYVVSIDGEYRVHCAYLESDFKLLLWVENEKPHWLEMARPPKAD